MGYLFRGRRNRYDNDYVTSSRDYVCRFNKDFFCFFLKRSNDSPLGGWGDGIASTRSSRVIKK